MVEIDTLVPIFIAFGLGIVSGVVVKYFQDRFLRPVIIIENYVVTAFIHLRPAANHPKMEGYYANRITVRNTGRTAAKECKAYVQFPNSLVGAERTGWMLPDKNSGYTITLNVDDYEYIDFCAIREDGQKRLITTERGFSEGTVESCRPLPGISELDVRVTSSTAAPYKRKLRFLQNATADGRILDVD